MDQRQRRLVLIGAAAGPRVVRRIENSVGHDKVGRASRLKATQVARAAFAQQIVETGCPGPEGQQVFAGNDVETAQLDQPCARHLHAVTKSRH